MEYDAHRIARSLSLLRSLPDSVPDCSRPFLIAFNCIGMLFSGTLACVGLFAYSERYPMDAKDTILNTTVLGHLATNIELACLITGVSLFTLFAVGYVAAVRLDETLLWAHSGCLASLTVVTFLASVIVAVVPFVASPAFHRLMKADVLSYYGHNADWDHLVDFVQSRLHCCGIGVASLRDWDQSPRFHCSVDNPSADRCGVPASCCRDQNAARANRFCGRGAQNASTEWARNRVHNRGCVTVVVDYVRGRVLVIGSLFVLVTLLLAIAAATAHGMSRRGNRRRPRLQNISRNRNDPAFPLPRRVIWADIENSSFQLYQQPEILAYDEIAEPAVIFPGRNADEGWLPYQDPEYANQRVPIEGTAEWDVQEHDYNGAYEMHAASAQAKHSYAREEIPIQYYDSRAY